MLLGSVLKLIMLTKSINIILQVDIYGKCGTLTCSRKNETACWDMVERDYLFYLSFENSLCTDYITEKFFNAITKNIIPIVLGGALNGTKSSSDYINGLGAPTHSFIDARQYSSPKQLAEYLNSLYASPELYAEYFWWKDHYKVTYDPVNVTAKNYCDICRRLHEEPGDVERNHKVIKDLHEFWDQRYKCERVRV